MLTLQEEVEVLALIEQCQGAVVAALVLLEEDEVSVPLEECRWIHLRC